MNSLRARSSEAAEAASVRRRARADRGSSGAGVDDRTRRTGAGNRSAAGPQDGGDPGANNVAVRTEHGSRTRRKRTREITRPPHDAHRLQVVVRGTYESHTIGPRGRETARRPRRSVAPPINLTADDPAVRQRRIASGSFAIVARRARCSLSANGCAPHGRLVRRRTTRWQRPAAPQPGSRHGLVERR